MNEQQEKRVKVILSEYKIISDEIKERIGRGDKIMGVGLTILGAGLTYGIKEEIYELLIVVPFAFFAIIFYAVFNTTVVLTLGGHKKYLAEKVNMFCGENMLVWEEVSRKIIHWNISQISLYVLYCVFLIIAIIIGYSNTYDIYCKKGAIMYSISIVTLVVLLSLSLKTMSGAFKNSYELSKIASTMPNSHE